MFSGAVKLADINDYLGPSQECIKPQLDAKKKREEDAKAKTEEAKKISFTKRKSARNKRTRNGARGIVKLEPEMDVDGHDSSLPSVGGGHFNQIRTSADGRTLIRKRKQELKLIYQISGCVTSAETILITAQSLDKFKKQLAHPSKTVVVSIAPMALAGIAVAHKLSILETARRIKAFLRDAGVKKFADQSVAQSLSLKKSCEEFVRRFKANKLPVLCSECPGWVCYAEKTQGDQILQYMSSTRSPQQVMGVLIKNIMAKEISKVQRNVVSSEARENIVHCAVMPCYDKKLESSRPEFREEDTDEKDVEIVLTTDEFMKFIHEKNGEDALQGLKGEDLDPIFFNVSSEQKNLFRPPALGASGGYLENVFKHAAKELFDKDIGGELKTVAGRNSDIQEASLVVDGEEKLKFALAYGFRNIQNVMRKLKRKQNKYHYVELMACPNGCANGGGQIKRNDMKPKELSNKLKELYYDLEVRNPDETPIVELFEETFKGSRRDSYLNMTFQDVSKGNENEDSATKGLTVKW